MKKNLTTGKLEERPPVTKQMPEGPLKELVDSTKSNVEYLKTKQR